MVRKVLISIIAAIMMGVTMVAPVMAATCDDVEQLNENNGKRCVPTSIFGKDYRVDGETVRCSCDGGSTDASDGEIMRILNLVVSILTIGVGILGVLGISIVGIQYLTAGGNEEKTRKAKKRIVEIVIGIVVYVLIYALLYWLLPGFGGAGG